MSIDDLFIRAEAAGADGSFTRIDETHPVGVFIGIEAGQRAVMIVCPARPPDAPSLGAILVEARPRSRGEWALVVRLEQRDLVRQFTRLANDLAAATLAEPTKPGEAAIAELVRWRRLLSRRPNAILEDHEVRGLAGELSFLVEEAVPQFGALAAATAWVGPYEAPKDFAFPDVEVEVKATRRQPRTIRISSLEQLTDTGNPLFLWCRPVELEQTQPMAGRSMSSLVNAARRSVAHDSTAAQLVEDALLAAGYRDRPEYDRIQVRLGSARCFSVVAGFPRIQRPAVDPGVSVGTYEISTSAIAGFEVQAWRVGVRRGE